MGEVSEVARKVKIKVLIEIDEEGQGRPRSLTWEDGRQFVIDRVLDVRPAVALKTGGSGLRYTCRISGREVYLFEDRGKWFMEGRDT